MAWRAGSRSLMIESLLSGSFGAVIAVMAERHFWGQSREEEQRAEKNALLVQLELNSKAIQSLSESMKDLSRSLQQHVAEMRSEFKERDRQLLTIEQRLGHLSGLSGHVNRHDI